MAKKATKAVKRGGGTSEQQINKLTEKVGPKGVALAEELIKDGKDNPYTADILRLAVKMDTRKPARQGGLGSRIETILMAIGDPEVRERTRKVMLKAKEDAKK
jgi:hypothetical protein